MTIAYLQEFTINEGDTSTTNYDAVAERLRSLDTPDGLLIHTAGFDHDAGVFRILDVWESRELGQRFMDDHLQPVLDEMIAAQPDPSAFTPPDRETWYELHDVMR